MTPARAVAILAGLVLIGIGLAYSMARGDAGAVAIATVGAIALLQMSRR